MFRGICYLFRFIFRIQKKYIITLLFMEIAISLMSIINIVLPKSIIDSIFCSERSYRRIIFILGIYIAMIAFFNILIGKLKYASEKERDSLYSKYCILQGRQFLNMEHEKLENPEFIKLRDMSTRYINAYGFAGIIPVTTMLIGKLITVVSLISIITLLDVRVCIIYLVVASINLVLCIKNKRKIISEDMNMVEAERRRDYIVDIFEQPKFAKEMRSYNLCKWLLHKYTTEYDQVYNHKNVQNKMKMKNNFLHIITDTIQLGAIYVYLMYSTIKNNITVGNFTLYLSSMIVFNNTILDFANTVIDLKQYDQYFEPFMQFSEYLESIEDGTQQITKHELQYVIQFNDVSFKYPGQDHYALRHINLKISTGNSICIVGENGAGKTTLIKLLLRFYHVTEGTITLNGINIWDYEYEHYLQCFSVLFQDFKLFATSIKENVVLDSKYNDADARLRCAFELSGVNKILENKKIDDTASVYKIFDSDGIEFSGGESQKIAFARTLYRNTPIILLDEPSSALDPISESEMIQKFADISKDKLAIFISHRLTSAKICNRILVFQNGEIVEDGSHDKLMNEDKIYASLYRMQSELYN